MKMRWSERVSKGIKLALVPWLAYAGYLAFWAESEGSVRWFLFLAFGPFMLAVWWDEFLGFLRTWEKADNK
ncbi:MAG: hypothetical protein BZY88_06875 [SAR202 cluster bacterium Io17-Chloro-G9]|nr:MAG: hypothetical protein BZY88_06875 [SAR202 cluster bacterium Io17-Chloro-G9]